MVNWKKYDPQTSLKFWGSIGLIIISSIFGMCYVTFQDYDDSIRTTNLLRQRPETPALLHAVFAQSSYGAAANFDGDVYHIDVEKYAGQKKIVSIIEEFDCIIDSIYLMSVAKESIYTESDLWKNVPISVNLNYTLGDESFVVDIPLSEGAEYKWRLIFFAIPMAWEGADKIYSPTCYIKVQFGDAIDGEM